MGVPRYQSSVPGVTWTMDELKNPEMKERVKRRLRVGLIDNHEDYQKVISYMYKKYPQEMDGLPHDGKENVAIQWHYSAGKNALHVHNSRTMKDQNMYAFVLYDAERDMEPVAFAGSYFGVGSAVVQDEENVPFLCDANGVADCNGKYQRVGYGIVMFVDPQYRRLGLATDLWWMEAQLYREALGIRFQREVQNTYSLESTRRMFSDPAKCIVTSEGRLKADGTRSQIRCLLDYMDQDVVDGFESLMPNFKELYNEPAWNFVRREDVSDLEKIWETGKLVV